MSAIEGMVEVLPPHASYGKGVQFVLEHILKVDPKAVMALGVSLATSATVIASSSALSKTV